MSALPPHETRLMRAAASHPGNGGEPARQAARTLGGDRTPAALAERWVQVHASAARIAELAELSPDRASGAIAAFPAAIEAADAWQRELAWQGLEDVEAIMRPGLTALETIIARGGTPVAPALALWREFHGAREALLMLARSTIEMDAL